MNIFPLAPFLLLEVEREIEPASVPAAGALPVAPAPIGTPWSSLEMAGDIIYAPNYRAPAGSSLRIGTVKAVPPQPARADEEDEVNPLRSSTGVDEILRMAAKLLPALGGGIGLVTPRVGMRVLFDPAYGHHDLTQICNGHQLFLVRPEHILAEVEE